MGNGSLERDWHGAVWLNPPYGKGSGLFTLQLVAEFDAGRVEQAVLSSSNAYGFLIQPASMCSGSIRSASRITG